MPRHRGERPKHAQARPRHRVIPQRAGTSRPGPASTTRGSAREPCAAPRPRREVPSTVPDPVPWQGPPVAGEGSEGPPVLPTHSTRPHSQDLRPARPPRPARRENPDQTGTSCRKCQRCAAHQTPHTREPLHPHTSAPSSGRLPAAPPPWPGDLLRVDGNRATAVDSAPGPAGHSALGGRRSVVPATRAEVRGPRRHLHRPAPGPGPAGLTGLGFASAVTDPGSRAPAAYAPGRVVQRRRTRRCGPPTRRHPPPVSGRGSPGRQRPHPRPEVLARAACCRCAGTAGSPGTAWPGAAPMGVGVVVERERAAETQGPSGTGTTPSVGTGRAGGPGRSGGGGAGPDR